jgi:hypothetical protein
LYAVIDYVFGNQRLAGAGRRAYDYGISISGIIYRFLLKFV